MPDFIDHDQISNTGEALLWNVTLFFRILSYPAPAERARSQSRNTHGVGSIAKSEKLHIRTEEGGVRCRGGPTTEVAVLRDYDFSDFDL